MPYSRLDGTRNLFHALLGKMRAAHGWSPHQLRDLHFDVLIALTARSRRARLITSNRRDFELIHGYRKFGLEVWT